MKDGAFSLFAIAVVFTCLFTSKLHAQNTFDYNQLDSTLSEILRIDQTVRNNWEQDSINQSIVFPIIDKILSGEITELAPNSWQACFLVIQHAEIKDQLRYANFIRTYFDKGHIQNYEYLVFMDRINVRSNKAQLFGSQVAELPNGTILVYPVRPKVERDSAFHSIGLDPTLFKVIDGTMRYGKSVRNLKDENNSSDRQYEPIEIAENDFVFLGLVYSPDNIPEPIENAKIKIDNQLVATTDKNGFFSFKTTKNKIPDSLFLDYSDNNTKVYFVDKSKCNGDFIIVKQR